MDLGDLITTYENKKVVLAVKQDNYSPSETIVYQKKETTELDK
jgi:hypothetical protein